MTSKKVLASWWVALLLKQGDFIGYNILLEELIKYSHKPRDYIFNLIHSENSLQFPTWIVPYNSERDRHNRWTPWPYCRADAA